MILSPQWLAWFLAALFIWRLTTPIWRALRYPITTSIIISLAVGLIEVPNVLALPKVLGFLPFYVVGMHMNRRVFERLGTTSIASPPPPCSARALPSSVMSTPRTGPPTGCFGSSATTRTPCVQRRSRASPNELSCSPSGSS